MSRMKCGICSRAQCTQKVILYLRRLRQGSSIKEVDRGGDLELQHRKLGRTEEEEVQQKKGKCVG